MAEHGLRALVQSDVDNALALFDANKAIQRLHDGVDLVFNAAHRRVGGLGVLLKDDDSCFAHDLWF